LRTSAFGIPVFGGPGLLVELNDRIQSGSVAAVSDLRTWLIAALG